MSSLGQTLTSLLPDAVVDELRVLRQRIHRQRYRGLTTAEVFTKIYAEGAWGRSPDASQRFFSGSGSDDDAIVGSYVDAMRAYLSGFERKPDVVDLGCGDFRVGARLRPLCGRYVACDIVPPLIAFNRERFASMDVDFRVLDLTRDELPDGDIVCIRQVLQHLSNAQIANALPRLARRYRHLVLTEHLPAADDFVPNIDKPDGPDIRLYVGSGVVLTQPPFDLPVREERTLCLVAEAGGWIRTTLYVL